MSDLPIGEPVSLPRLGQPAPPFEAVTTQGGPVGASSPIRPSMPRSDRSWTPVAARRAVAAARAGASW